MKDHYKLGKREQSLIDYWESQAKKGNENAKDVLDFRDYLIERESRIVGTARRVCILSRLKFVEQFFDKTFRKTDLKGMLKALNKLDKSTLKNGKPRSPCHYT